MAKRKQQRPGLTTLENELVDRLERIATEAQELADDIVSGAAANYDGYFEVAALNLNAVEICRMIHQGVLNRDAMRQRYRGN